MSNGSPTPPSSIAGGLSTSNLVISNSITSPVLTARSRSHPTFHFLAGLLSGLSSAILLQPADLLKTRVQQSSSTTLSSTFQAILAHPSPLRELWRGTVPSALRTGLGSALYFTSLSSLRSLAVSTSSPERKSTVLPRLSPGANLLAGATARVGAGFVLMPMTVIKVRYESNLYAYKTIASAMRAIYSAEGVRGFFTGFGATAIRDAPYAGIYVVFYEALKTKLNAWTDTDKSEKMGRRMLTGSSINAASGLVAAGLATAVTNPFDAVKTRIQLMPDKYRNMATAVRLMVREDGVKAFFDGLGLRMGRKAMSSALAWTVYEELIGRAERRLVDKNVM